MPHIVLHQPEIPPNTGNIIRLCANTNTSLHLVHPLGFTMTKKSLRRAYLDYEEFTKIKHHNNIIEMNDHFSGRGYYAISTKGKTLFNTIKFKQSDVFLFGSETQGLPQNALSSEECLGVLRVPMAEGSRSINLANTVSIVLYEALRQLEYPGLT
ncbi:MAG: tRNA (uridine(34)/cytosine(34)/5-carboxymethylaminomethyluridine(34)-2'-O)-methyltransferase TrmL [Rhodospirillaceae bacterium]|nr:tRNA (uridine(34)/cytosine(34)/5-carboxymethylaminomethyluridine(34)-2'-O)-methyltransferase TrmL [Rhodospirillaceae bacterium]